MGYYESGINIPMNNLYDEMKMQTLIDLYNIYTLEELTQLKNKK